MISEQAPSPARIGDFSGTIPPQRSARRENCLSAKSEFFPGSEARTCMVEKCQARGGIMIFKNLFL
jgi:hypothetical protein